MAENEKVVSDIPPLEGISNEPKEVRDIRIPTSGKNTPTDPEASASFKATAFPENYISPGKPEYEKMVGAWKESNAGGQVQIGGRYFKVIKPDGYPVFVPIAVSLDNAYASLSGGASRK